ncbi:hypothetical protein FJY71_03485 [candidate division WOR-3 bacterium]|nr:hypothetical protein [candidate division WOR-3 bacterium]
MKEAVRKLEPEIVIADEALATRVRLLLGLRVAATVVVFVILAAALFMVTNPLHWPLLETREAGIVKNILLGVGILMLFAEYLMPVARLYKAAGQGAGGLKLVPRKPK